MFEQSGDDKMAKESKNLKTKAKQPFPGTPLSYKCLAATSDSSRIDFRPLEKLFSVTDLLLHMKDRSAHWSVLLP